ncbi:Serine/threonine-protein kinase 40 [Folsomia candida]|uniref:Serine/threonine-protein kinase 40 n=2 Tax=Folsomia candida TaxID=158441 RepID=A0A226CWR5_FOLCA|nr:Serine/threonine-protein kinase 40 [Folsomia candida]
MDQIQGHILTNTEYTLLKSLRREKGVVQLIDLYKELVEVGTDGHNFGRMRTRIYLVLECYTPHDFSTQYTNLITLQQLVIKVKKVPEYFTIRILYNVVNVLPKLHQKDIVHRDIKLGNIVWDKYTKKVTLTNFGLSKHLTCNEEQLIDQRGSPAYISPEIISGRQYTGKPTDLWALGVVCFTMLFGNFPFLDTSPTYLFRKIKQGHYEIPSDVIVTEPTVKIIRSLLLLDPQKRLTARKTLVLLKEIIHKEEILLSDVNLQVVPDI